jgi:hypothetical protein
VEHKEYVELLWAEIHDARNAPSGVSLLMKGMTLAQEAKRKTLDCGAAHRARAFADMVFGHIPYKIVHR